MQALPRRQLLWHGVRARGGTAGARSAVRRRPALATAISRREEGNGRLLRAVGRRDQPVPLAQLARGRKHRIFLGPSRA